MTAYQEPKYRIEVVRTPGDDIAASTTARLVNRQSGEPIPEDEPLFILRARDIHAASVIDYYRRLVGNKEHEQAVAIRQGQFMNWAACHPSRMKVPDSQKDEGWTNAGTPPQS